MKRNDVLRHLVYVFIYIAVYSIFPLLFLWMPKTFGYYAGILDLWVFNPLNTLVITAIICRKYGFLFYLPMFSGIGFLVALFVFYEEKQFVFLIAYVLISLLGCFLGEKLYDEKVREIY